MCCEWLEAASLLLSVVGSVVPSACARHARFSISVEVLCGCLRRGRLLAIPEPRELDPGHPAECQTGCVTRALPVRCCTGSTETKAEHLERKRSAERMQ